MAFQPLDGTLAFHRGALVWLRFQVHEPDGSARAGITRAASGIVDLQPSLDVHGPAGIVGAVAALDNVAVASD